MINDLLRNFGKRTHSESAPLAPGPSPAGPESSVSLPPPSPHKTGFEREALGGFHESLRLKCESVVFKFNELTSAIGAVDDLFREFAKISEDLQAQTSANVELSCENLRLSALQESLDERVRTLETERIEAEEKLRRAEAVFESQRSEARRFADQISQLETQAQENASEVNGLRRELITLQPLYADLTDETARLRQRIDELSQELAAARASADALELRAIAENEALESERKSLRELNMRYVDARQQWSESEQAQARLRANLEQMQAEVARLKEVDRALRLVAEEERTRRETDAASYEAKLFAVRSRSELVERLLEKARDELRLHVDATRRAEQMSARLAQSEDALVAVRADLVKTKDELIQLQNSRDNLATQVSELSRASSAQENEIQRLTSEKLDQRRAIDFAAAAHQKDLQKLQSQIRTLEDQLMKEKSERAYAEGALDTARRDRLQLQRIANELKREEALALVTPPEDTSSAPTTLRAPDQPARARANRAQPNEQGQA